MKADLTARFKKSFTTDVSDVLDEMGIDGVVVGLTPIYQGAVICGPAVTMRQVRASSKGLNLNRFVAVIEDITRPGDVIVIDAESAGELASWGGTMALRSQSRGAEGVIDAGYARDVDAIRAAKFPVFCRGISPKTGTPYFETVDLNQPIQIGGKVVHPGDLMFADGDGVVIVPAAKAEEVLILAEKRTMKVEEGRVLARAGKSPFGPR